MSTPNPSSDSLKKRKNAKSSNNSSSWKKSKSSKSNSNVEAKTASFEGGLTSKLKILSALIAISCFIYVAYDSYISKKVSATPEEDPTSDIRSNSYKVKPSLPFHLPTQPLPKQPLDKEADVEKQEAVKAAFKYSWDAYRRDAWASDEYHPLSQGGSNLTEEGGIGYTIVDALDTLLIMGFQDEYNEARDWVKEELAIGRNGKFNVFETTIRMLGGLLSAHALCAPIPSGISDKFNKLCDKTDAFVYLTGATALAERLSPAFRTPTGIPMREINLMTGEAFADVDNGGAASLAEVSSIQLEFKYMAYLNQQKVFWTIAERPMAAIRAAAMQGAQDGLLPIFLSPETGQFYLSEIRLGSRGDSYYEYLLKQYLLTNRKETVYRDMYDRAMAGIKKSLIRESVFQKPPLLFTTEVQPFQPNPKERHTFRLIPKQDHLVCFLGGSLMLGATESQSPIPPTSLKELGQRQAAALEDWSVGHELIRTCVETYKTTKTGLGPEIAHFRLPQEKERMRELGVTKEEDWYIKQSPPSADGLPASTPLIDARNILRPETVESLFIAYQQSGDPIYREWGWEIFQAFEKHCKVETGGYASIDDVDSDNPIQQDRMETFWLSETLKYLYLLFSDQDTLPLDKWVFNTEAHPFPIFNPPFETSFE